MKSIPLDRFAFCLRAARRARVNVLHQAVLPEIRRLLDVMRHARLLVKRRDAAVRVAALCHDSVSQVTMSTIIQTAIAEEEQTWESGLTKL